jgi:hypothetical protein
MLSICDIVIEPVTLLYTVTIPSNLFAISDESTTVIELPPIHDNCPSIVNVTEPPIMGDNTIAEFDLLKNLSP